jgi:hypothetical protein
MPRPLGLGMPRIDPPPRRGGINRVQRFIYPGGTQRGEEAGKTILHLRATVHPTSVPMDRQGGVDEPVLAALL